MRTRQLVRRVLTIVLTDPKVASNARSWIRYAGLYSRSESRGPNLNMRVLLMVALLAVILTALIGLSSPPSRRHPVHAVEDAPPTKGSLRISTYGDGPSGKEPTLHTSVLVNGTGYAGMEDNDLRGHLDGTFIYGWNQASQSHVRAGRRKINPRYGEYELFRFLQRWTGIDIPRLTTIVEARLDLYVENGPGFPVRVMLYEVKHDWDPGQGGTLKDNASPPVRGEVWWNDRAYEQQSWALPGVGYASDTDPEADTGEAPLAEALYEPGDEMIQFSSTDLAAYVTERLRTGHPFLFLVKLADYHEDISGSLLLVYSGNHGDSRNVVRRPRLTLAWRSAAELATVERPVFVEHGRSLDLPTVDTRGASFLTATFAADPESPLPTLSIRGAAGGGVTEWERMPAVVRSEWDSVEMRVTAASNVVALGKEFTAEVMNTWVRSAPPEEQVVPWRFVSPTGFVHEVEAEYLGDYRWLVRFEPNELGIWRYRWSEQFDGAPEESPEGRFDVVVGEREALRQQLESLLQEFAAADIRRDRSLWERLVNRLTRLKRNVLPQEDGDLSEWQLRERLRTRFTRLERGVIQLENAESFPRFPESEIYRLMREIREQLGQPVPDPIPLVPVVPPPYMRNGSSGK